MLWLAWTPFWCVWMCVFQKIAWGSDGIQGSADWDTIWYVCICGGVWQLEVAILNVTHKISWRRSWERSAAVCSISYICLLNTFWRKGGTVQRNSGVGTGGLSQLKQVDGDSFWNMAPVACLASQIASEKMLFIPFISLNRHCKMRVCIHQSGF